MTGLMSEEVQHQQQQDDQVDINGSHRLDQSGSGNTVARVHSEPASIGQRVTVVPSGPAHPYQRNAHRPYRSHMITQRGRGSFKNGKTGNWNGFQTQNVYHRPYTHNQSYERTVPQQQTSSGTNVFQKTTPVGAQLGLNTPLSYASAATSPFPSHEAPSLRTYIGSSNMLENYELLDKLGEGTFGEVYRGRHRHTNQLVALKKILMHNEKDGFPITALREIKILKMLLHENIIELSDMAVERGNRQAKKRAGLRMVFPYMEHDLCGLIDNPSVKLSPPHIKCFLKQLLQGIAYLHSKRIIHRDMKSANLLISKGGVLKIADFGLARSIESERLSDSEHVMPHRDYTNLVVTRWYRPPELLLGERRYTTSIDIWGAGCILAEMLKVKPILMGSSDLDQLDLIFKLCGTPKAKEIKSYQSLESWTSVKYTVYARTLEFEYSSFGPPVVDFLANLLSLDPYARLTARMALQHHIFTTSPLPCEPHEIPQLPSSHEIDGKRTRAIAAAPRGAGVENHESVRYHGEMPASKRLRTNAPPRVPSESTRGDSYIPNYGSPNSSLPSSIQPSGQNSTGNAATSNNTNVISGASVLQRSMTQSKISSEIVSRPQPLDNTGVHDSTSPHSSQSSGLQVGPSSATFKRDQLFDAKHPPTEPRSMTLNKSNHQIPTKHHDQRPREFVGSVANNIEIKPNLRAIHETSDKIEINSLESRELTHDYLPSQEISDASTLSQRDISIARNSVSPDENGAGYSFKVRLGDYYIDRWVPGSPGK